MSDTLYFVGTVGFILLGIFIVILIGRELKRQDALEARWGPVQMAMTRADVAAQVGLTIAEYNQIELLYPKAGFPIERVRETNPDEELRLLVSMARLMREAEKPLEEAFFTIMREYASTHPWASQQDMHQK